MVDLATRCYIPSAVPEPSLLINKRSHLATSKQNLIIGLWLSDATVEGARDFAELYARFSRQHPEGFGVLLIIEQGVSMPDARTRQALASAMDRVPNILCMAAVQESQGFLAATFRGVITAMSLLSRERYPKNVFGSVPDAAAWIAPRLGASGLSVNAGHIVREVAQFRQPLAKHG